MNLSLTKLDVCLMPQELNNSLNCLLSRIPYNEVKVPHAALKELIEHGWVIQDRHKYSREVLTFYSEESLQIGCGAIIRNEAFVITRGINKSYTFVRQEIIRGNIFVRVDKAIERLGSMVKITESLEISSYALP